MAGETAATNPSCIEIPSPGAIHRTLFARGLFAPVSLPKVWSARLLLTPAGGLSGSPIVPGDQLVVGSLIYDASARSQRLMRIRLYLLESRNYYDFLFRTSARGTQWWWLISDPGKPAGLPVEAYGPFATPAAVPAPDFLAGNLFAHAGTWNVLGRPRDAFSAALDGERPATWYWFDSGSERLARIMNIRTDNDYRVAVLGAYYLVDFPNFRRLASSNLGRVHAFCASSATRVPAVNSMVTLRAILAAMAAPPSGSQIKCTLQQIQALIPGISYPAEAVAPPAWTDRVHHHCCMIGRPPFPYYGQVWYDWSRGMQVTVLVGKSDEDGLYGQRFDLFLPRGKDDGPRIHYIWNGSAWTPACQERLGVAMPWPDFVERGEGRCRAILEDNPYFGSLTIWSVPLPGQSTDWSANFWFWFDLQQRQMIFSLDPPNNLTLTDFQTFVRDAVIEPCLLAQPAGLPDCSPPSAKIASPEELHHFMSPTSIKPARNSRG